MPYFKLIFLAQSIFTPLDAVMDIKQILGRKNYRKFIHLKF